MLTGTASNWQHHSNGKPVWRAIRFRRILFGLQQYSLQTKRSYILRLTESTLVEALNIAVEARPSIQPGLHIPIYLCTPCERKILLWPAHLGSNHDWNSEVLPSTAVQQDHWEDDCFKFYTYWPSSKRLITYMPSLSPLPIEEGMPHRTAALHSGYGPYPSW